MNPGRIRILAVGKVRKSWVREGLEVYRRRMPGLSIVELRDTDPVREAQAIRAELRSDEQLITLSEEGRTFRSRELAHHLNQSGSDRLAFVIGGADGLDPALRARAQWQLSLSALTFPHELARLLLLEQLYRAQTILQGGPYHRE
ncbi:23S rRNA (pseudouridine(1915)-N(3))-methyltransferase RlmH [Cyanobium sp. NIES-981]|uniref:23S rRNA (pseudouridine(1915)-N(3))-methyltransferase RlmH n=1 Tax=Cyanobium sp. NIES-981 TaxID=1851505 RepID=UPI000B35CA01|nr:23S rRNA (pseudouridine(1915)-N(3))-methyltransferase RlmH [Cyanobium sp. NIES-981]